MDLLDLDSELQSVEAFLAAPDLPTKSCKDCGEADLSKLASYVRRGKVQVRNWCKKCKTLHAKKWDSENPEKRRRFWQMQKKKISAQRKSGENLGPIILEDCRGGDRKRGHENDLTLEFVNSLVSRGCEYCKTQIGRISLDRIDNDLGHTKDNVVPACLRCNYTRGGMPYEAWVVVAPAMLEALSDDLFSGWTYKHFDFSK